jgi:hypothetical protein
MACGFYYGTFTEQALGFYFRKSKKIGPFRMTASKSGLSFSAGVKGFRVSTGPRGQYITMGSNGLYYRKRIGGGSRPATGAGGPKRSVAAPGPPMHPIEASRLGELAASSPRETVAMLRELALPAKPSAGSCLALLVAAACLLGGISSGTWGGFLVGGAVALVFFLWGGHLQNRAAAQRTHYLGYDLDDEMRQAWLGLTDALEAIGSQGQLWRVAAFGERHRTPHEELRWGQMQREPLHVVRQNPPGIEANVTILALVQASHTLYVLPDLLLVYDEPKKGDWRVGAIQYAELNLAFEEFGDALESPPADTPVTGYTWLHATKSGQPDQRYRHNPRLHLCRLGLLRLDSSRGLREWLVVSDPAKGLALYSALQHLQALTDPFAPAHEQLADDAEAAAQ